jgi:phospholipid N-methyltransferase
MSVTDATSFFLNFVRHPRDVSSVIPTSRISARRIAAAIRPAGRTVAVEYGPGVGSVSAAVLERLGPGDRLILIEKTPALAAGLKRRFVADDRVIVVEGDAKDVESILRDHGESRAHYVLCSIPLSLIDPPVRESILASTARVLGAEGTFVVFLFRRQATASYLRGHFPRTTPGRILPWNLPPLWFFEAKI